MCEGFSRPEHNYRNKKPVELLLLIHTSLWTFVLKELNGCVFVVMWVIFTDIISQNCCNYLAHCQALLRCVHFELSMKFILNIYGETFQDAHCRC